MPALYVYNPGWGGAIMYRLSPNVNTQQALKKIGDIFSKYNPSFPFAYRFADEAYNATFQLESLIGTLAGIFAGAGHIYFVPWLIWHGSLRGRATYQRNRNT